jgi:hypothetical protein
MLKRQLSRRFDKDCSYPKKEVENEGEVDNF